MTTDNYSYRSSSKENKSNNTVSLQLMKTIMENNNWANYRDAHIIRNSVGRNISTTNPSSMTQGTLQKDCRVQKSRRSPEKQSLLECFCKKFLTKHCMSRFKLYTEWYSGNTLKFKHRIPHRQIRQICVYAVLIFVLKYLSVKSILSYYDHNIISTF